MATVNSKWNTRKKKESNYWTCALFDLARLVEIYYNISDKNWGTVKGQGSISGCTYMVSGFTLSSQNFRVTFKKPVAKGR